MADRHRIGYGVQLDRDQIAPPGLEWRGPFMAFAMRQGEHAAGDQGGVSGGPEIAKPDGERGLAPGGGYGDTQGRGTHCLTALPPPLRREREREPRPRAPGR